MSVSHPHAAPLLLASTSPQRRAILEQLGIPFEVVAPEYEEHDPPEADAEQLVRDHALGTARSVAAQAGDRPVLGVDTTVVLGGRIYTKPTDAGDAERMLDELAGLVGALKTASERTQLRVVFQARELPLEAEAVLAEFGVAEVG